jgi:hypothetical protein
MLPRKSQSALRADPSCLKNGAIVVETLESLLQFNKGLFIENIAVSKIAEFQECTKCTKHIPGYITFDGREIDLVG